MAQTLLTIFIPTLTVLVCIFLNRNDSSRISSFESRLDGRIGGPESKLHSDMMQVVGNLTELGARVARLEQAG